MTDEAESRWISRRKHTMDDATPIDIERAISALPPGARDIVVLHGIYGYSHEEAAGDARRRRRHLQGTAASRAPPDARAHGLGERDMNTIPFGPRNDRRKTRCSRRPRSCRRTSRRRATCGPAIAARLAGEPQQARSRSFGWPARSPRDSLVASVSALLTWGLMRDTGRRADAGRGHDDGPSSPDAAIVPVSYGPNSGSRRRNSSHATSCSPSSAKNSTS